MLRHILDNFSNATATHATYATSDGVIAPQVARVARVQVATPQITHISANDEVISNWWEITFTGLPPVLVAVWPPCTHAEVMALNQNATSAVAIPSPINETVRLQTND